MVRDFLNMSTPAAIAIVVICIVIENRFPEIFKDNTNGKRIKVSINLSDWRHSLFLLTSIGVIFLHQV